MVFGPVSCGGARERLSAALRGCSARQGAMEGEAAEEYLRLLHLPEVPALEALVGEEALAGNEPGICGLCLRARSQAQPPVDTGLCNSHGQLFHEVRLYNDMPTAAAFDRRTIPVLVWTPVGGRGAHLTVVGCPCWSLAGL